MPIPGTTKLHRLDENLGAASIQITADDLQRIEDALSKITVEGDRYHRKWKRLPTADNRRTNYLKKDICSAV